MCEKSTQQIRLLIFLILWTLQSGHLCIVVLLSTQAHTSSLSMSQRQNNYHVIKGGWQIPSASPSPSIFPLPLLFSLLLLLSSPSPSSPPAPPPLSPLYSLLLLLLSSSPPPSPPPPLLLLLSLSPLPFPPPFTFPSPVITSLNSYLQKQ